METTLDYLKSTKQQFTYYKQLGEKSMAQLPDNKLFLQPNENSNSIATIAKHLWGNMLSRWTDFLTTDGEKEWRQRDAEFENDIQTREELLSKWNEGWQCLFNALDSISDKDLSKTIYIRNDGHTILEAINRQVAHYAYHVGQIVYAAKLLKEEEWSSLSIPKNASAQYNEKKFSQEKGDRHFTDDLLKN
ncbi:MAG: DUF1572 family protein [Flavipsychrobacter sp.]